MHEQASLEPPFLLRHRVALAKWKPVLDALDDVVLQTSAMESVLEGQGQFPLGILQEPQTLQCTAPGYTGCTCYANPHCVQSDRGCDLEDCWALRLAHKPWACTPADTVTPMVCRLLPLADSTAVSNPQVACFLLVQAFDCLLLACMHLTCLPCYCRQSAAYWVQQDSCCRHGCCMHVAQGFQLACPCCMLVSCAWDRAMPLPITIFHTI